MPCQQCFALLLKQPSELRVTGGFAILGQGTFSGFFGKLGQIGSKDHFHECKSTINVSSNHA